MQNKQILDSLQNALDDIKANVKRIEGIMAPIHYYGDDPMAYAFEYGRIVESLEQIAKKGGGVAIITMIQLKEATEEPTP